ncbi:hypothetical protein [Nocardioides caldifontis]|uniref:hypothetical protein n=1 Tax=Nocardioides caldifontis TaxID=2588938 RepID=UPI0011DF5C46|nr:hypothetical protein [Nocardioides caldifontis]
MAKYQDDSLPVVRTTTSKDEPTRLQNEQSPSDDRTDDRADDPTDEAPGGSEDVGDAPAGLAAGSWVPLVIALTVGVLIVIGIGLSWLL